MSSCGFGPGGCRGSSPIIPNARIKERSSCCPSHCCNPLPPCCIEIVPVKGCCPDVCCRKPRFVCPDPCCPTPDPRCCVTPRCFSVSCPQCPPPPKCPPPCPRWYFKDEDLGPLRGVKYP